MYCVDDNAKLYSSRSIVPELSMSMEVKIVSMPDVKSMSVVALAFVVGLLVLMTLFSSLLLMSVLLLVLNNCIVDADSGGGEYNACVTCGDNDCN